MVESPTSTSPGPGAEHAGGQHVADPGRPRRSTTPRSRPARAPTPARRRGRARRGSPAACGRASCRPGRAAGRGRRRRCRRSGRGSRRAGRRRRGPRRRRGRGPRRPVYVTRRGAVSQRTSVAARDAAARPDRARAGRRRPGRARCSPTELVEHCAGAHRGARRRPRRLPHASRPERALRPRPRRPSGGCARGGDLPPLLGVPTAIKDLNNTAGVRTTFGSPVIADFVPARRRRRRDQLAAAGTISLGKTNTPEFGFPCYTDNDLVGPRPLPVGPRPAGRRLQRRRGGRGGGRAACRSRRAATAAARSASRPASTACSASSRPAAGSATPRSAATSPAWAPTARWPAPSATPPRCSTRWPARCSATPPGRRRCRRARPSSAAADRPPGRLRIGRYARVGRSRTRPRAGGGGGVRRRRAAARRTSATTSRTSPPGLLGPEVLPSFERVWALSGTTLPVTRRRGSASCGRSPASCGSAGWRCRRRTAMAAMVAAAAVRPPLPAGDGRLRRPAGAGRAP